MDMTAPLPISEQMAGYMARSSWIRKMFEEGTRLKAEHGAENVFDFSIGNPNLEPPKEFKLCLSNLLTEETPGAHGYMPNPGYPSTRAAIAATVSKQQAVEVGAEHIVMTVGAGGALNVVLRALLNPGDEVLVSNPCFVEYGFYTDNHGGTVKMVPAAADFNLDLSSLEAAINPKTRVVLVNSPNNPTGVIYPSETLEALGAMLARKEEELGTRIFLVSDEPYRDIVYDDTVVPPVLSTYDDSLVVTSYSKNLSLAGERIGYIAANPAIKGIEQVMGACVLAVRILGFVNAPALMQRAVERLQGVSVDLSLYKRNRDVLLAALREAGLEVPEPAGAFYLFPRCPIDDDVAFAKEMAEELVLVVPGSGFFGPGHIRLAYCVAPETVDGAIPHIQEVVARYA
jgi:aspartate aminotransferase